MSLQLSWKMVGASYQMSLLLSSTLSLCMFYALESTVCNTMDYDVLGWGWGGSGWDLLVNMTPYGPSYTLLNSKA